ncbi:DEAD-box family helicase [Babesia caballi]|uniref:DEAD-box family helicase n=1 Tax=Babesia caballi TaxID=5871 RepID=A0AAV4LQM0_BABCB|nr:DEAD-box family helicase [Babesia caballi]
MRANVRAAYVVLIFFVHLWAVAAFLQCPSGRNADRRGCLPRPGQKYGAERRASTSRARVSQSAVEAGVAAAGERLFGEDPAGRLRKDAPPLEAVAELFALKRPKREQRLRESLVRTKVAWAEWEIRRFGYKLGTANRQMRKLVEQQKTVRNSFTSSREELEALRRAKHEVSVKLRVASRLRRLFIRYRNGLLSQGQPRVPYVPLKHRSENVPAELYAGGTRRYNNAKRFRALRQRREQEGLTEGLDENVDNRRSSLPLSGVVQGKDSIVRAVTGQTKTQFGTLEDSQGGKGCLPSWELTDGESIGDIKETLGRSSAVSANVTGAHCDISRSVHRRTTACDRGVSDRRRIERELLGLIAQAKNQAVGKKGKSIGGPENHAGVYPKDCKMYPGYGPHHPRKPPSSGDSGSSGSASGSEQQPVPYSMGYPVQQLPYGVPQYGGWQTRMQNMGASMMGYQPSLDMQAAHYAIQQLAAQMQQRAPSPQRNRQAGAVQQTLDRYARPGVRNVAPGGATVDPMSMMGFSGRQSFPYQRGVEEQHARGAHQESQGASRSMTEASVRSDSDGQPSLSRRTSVGSNVAQRFMRSSAATAPSQMSSARSSSDSLMQPTPKHVQARGSPSGSQSAASNSADLHGRSSPEEQDARHGGRIVIEEELRRRLHQMPDDPDELIAMAKPHVEIDVNFFTALGGVYTEYEDDTASISESLEQLHKKLNDLYAAMGRNVPSKQTEPVKVHEISVWDPVIKEMHDFQDLVDYEHREKRRRFKALSLAAQKLASKFENRKTALEQEEIKQKRQSCKVVANAVAVYWKKIERFAWERMKRDLQAALIEKKRLRLDKFVEDAIKLSISKNDKVGSGSKAGREDGSLKRHRDQEVRRQSSSMSDGTGLSQSENHRAVAEARAAVKRENVKGEVLPRGKVDSKVSLKREIMRDGGSAAVAEGSGPGGCEGDDEFVVSEEMKQMERDDALLDMAMETEEQGDDALVHHKQELNALEDDLNVPLEEVLRRYHADAEKFKEEHSSCAPSEGEETEASSDYTEGESDDDGSEGAAVAGASSESREAARSKRKRIESSSANAVKRHESGVAGEQDDPEGEFTLADDMLKQQEDEDKQLDEAISDEHSDGETGKQERAKEISALEDEANMPVEELIARYRAAGGYDEEGYGDSMDEDSGSDEGGSDVTPSSGETEMVDEEEGDEVQVPSLIRATLRPYQLDGLRWLASLHRKGSNGILADEMGLGKTLQTIALLAHLACDLGNWGPHLIVVPTSVLLNWEMEFKKFCPGFMILSYYGTPAERAKKRIGWNKEYAFNVCIASYATVVQDSYILKRKPWEYMVLDEAQNIKNFNSKRWQTLLTFNTKGRILLTGTPLQNSLQELWSLMHFILPEVFTSHSEFKEWFSDPLTESIEREQMGEDGHAADSQTSQLVKKLHTVLRPYLLRRLKKDVEKQMPSKYEHVIKCYLSRRQRVLYDEFISSRSAVEALKNPNYRSMLFVLMQLRKICNHPDQLQSRPVESPYYDPEMMEDEVVPSVLLLPEPGSRGRLYRHEAFAAPVRAPETLPITLDARGPVDRVALPMSFVKNQRGAKVPFQRLYKQGTNAYEANLASLPVVSRFPVAKCLLSRKSGGRRKLTLSGFLVDMMLSSSPYAALKQGSDWQERAGEAGRPEPRKAEETPARICSTSARESAAQAANESAASPERTQEGAENVTPKKARRVLEIGVFAPRNSPAFESQQRDCPAQKPAAPPPRQASAERRGGGNGEAAAVELKPSTKPSERSVEVEVVVNRRELLDVDDSFLVRRFTIAQRPEPVADLFRTLVRPTVDNLVERHWWMLSRFVCTTGQGVECNPRRVFLTGPGGVARNLQRQATVDRVHSKLQRPSSFGYFRSTKHSIEHARGLQKVLFPPRSLLHDDCGKFLVLGRLLKRLKSEGHRCLLYTQFSKMLDILENWINFMGFTYVRLDGSTKVDMRQRIVTKFNENAKIFLFISSTRAGGVGLTLTGADTVIFYDTDWNPAMDRQAMDRCHRIGQTREVNVYRLISEHTVEENIWRKQLQKRRLDDIVVDKGNFDSEHHNWFSNVETLMNILKEQTGAGGAGPADEEDIYGRKVLHESEAPEVEAPAVRRGAAHRAVNLLVEAEDEDDAAALLSRSKEAGSSKDFQDFKGDMISSMPALVAYSIQLLLTYLTPALVAQRDEMKLKIKVESLDSGAEESGSSSSASEGKAAFTGFHRGGEVAALRADARHEDDAVGVGLAHLRQGVEAGGADDVADAHAGDALGLVEGLAALDDLEEDGGVVVQQGALDLVGRGVGALGQHEEVVGEAPVAVGAHDGEHVGAEHRVHGAAVGLEDIEDEPLVVLHGGADVAQLGVQEQREVHAANELADVHQRLLRVLG